MNNKKLLFSIFLVVLIDLLGFSLILPLLPFYAKTFNASDLTIGLLVTYIWRHIYSPRAAAQPCEEGAGC